MQPINNPFFAIHQVFALSRIGHFPGLVHPDLSFFDFPDDFGVCPIFSGIFPICPFPRSLPIEIRRASEGKWGRTKYRRIPESEGDRKGTSPKVFPPQKNSLKQGISSSHFLRDLSQVVRCTLWDTPVPLYTRTSHPLPMKAPRSVCAPLCCKNPEDPARQIDVSRQKLSPHCLEAIFDSQLPSPKLSPKMPPKLSLPHKRGLFILFQN